jgi:hypothetical protein
MVGGSGEPLPLRVVVRVGKTDSWDSDDVLHQYIILSNYI